MAYDADAHKTLMFGPDASHLNFEVWAYDHPTKTWERRMFFNGPSKDPHVAPDSYHEAAVVYDSVAGLSVGYYRFTKFGTFEGAYTFTYDYGLNQFVTYPALSQPGIPNGYAMAYDPANRVSVLFGGEYDGKTWEFDSALMTWTQTGTNSSLARTDTALAYDPGAGGIVMYGGQDMYGSSLLDTWKYDAGPNTWQQLYPSSPPTARYGHALVYDGRDLSDILFGGWDGADFLPNTYTLESGGTTWTTAMTTGPPLRMYHAMAFDSDCKVIVVFGGENASGDLGDTWILVVPP